MIRVAVNIDKDSVARAKRALGTVRPGVAVAVRAVRNVALAYYRELNTTEPNRLGGKRMNFWTDVGRSITQPVTEGDDQARIDITHPAFAQKVYGGEIRPKVKKWLAIPANALAYGKPPISFNLQFIPWRQRGGQVLKAMLVRKDAMKREVRFTTQGRHNGQVVTFEQRQKLPAGAVMYWLVKRVLQRPHDDPFPRETDMDDAAVSAFGSWLRRALGQIGQA